MSSDTFYLGTLCVSVKCTDFNRSKTTQCTTEQTEHALLGPIFCQKGSSNFYNEITCVRGLQR